MDPLSVTLTVVSLTTAVKDMVELGRKIHESFTKVSNNLSSAQRVAEDIRDMVEEIRAFCEDNKDALGDMKDFRSALEVLLAKFRSFETTILPLLPQPSARRRHRFIRGWNAWRNNNKVEKNLLDLQNDIVKVMRRYMMSSAMRAEVRLQNIHQETARGLKDVSDGLNVVQKDICALRVTATATHATPSGPTDDQFIRDIILFARSASSSSAPILRTPNVITEELMTTAYIKLQINNIVVKVKEFSVLSASTPNNIKKFRLFPYPELLSMNTTRLRHHAVRQVTSIRDLLDAEPVHGIPINAGASALHELSLCLQELHMGSEAILVADWAITLARMLVDASGGGQPDLCAKLALYLFNQSLICCQNGDKFRGLQTIEEAHAISQKLSNQYNGDIHFRILHSKALLQYAELVDNEQAITISLTAIQVLEDILQVRSFSRTTSDAKIKSIAQPNCSFLERLLSSAPPKSAIVNYALALMRLGTYLTRGGHPKSALYLGQIAIAVRRKMVSVYGQEYKEDLAWALSSMVLGELAYYMTADKLVNMIDECTQLLRELMRKNPVSYARGLVSVLWNKASILVNLDRGAEVVAVLEEAATLAGRIIQDSEICAEALGNLSDQFRRLKRHGDAAQTGELAITTYQYGHEIQALKYLNLSQDFQHLRHFKKSIETARASVALYRRLVMRDDVKWMSYLA